MPNNNRLLYITNQICHSGGLERVLSVKASYLADYLGYEVHILTLNQGDESLFYDFSDKIQYHDITLKRSPLGYLISYLKGIRSVVKKVRPDIICVCDDGVKGFLVPNIIKKQCPIVYERHVSRLATEVDGKVNFLNQFTTKIKYLLMDYGAKNYDAFVVLTKGNLIEWKSKNLKVISNPLSFYSEEKSLLKNKKVIAVGKHCNQKGYDRLLKSWQMVIMKHPDWFLEIYGAFSSSPTHDIKKLSINLGIEDNVKLYPPIKNIQEKFIDSSIHVLSSRYEGFGMVIIEAMSCGLPPVSYDCPYGPSDIITDKEDGILIENGNIESFGNALLELIENEDKRRAMGIAARNNVKRYLPDNIMKQWNQLFNILLNQ